MTIERRPFALRQRELEHYPEPATRRAYLALVVLITVALYYALYIGGGVAPLFMRDLHVSFGYYVGQLAVGNALGAFASLLAGMADRFGRSRLVLWGLLLVALLTMLAQPAATNRLTFAIWGIVIGFVEGFILVATPALMRDFSPQVGRATAMGVWAMGPVLGSLVTSAVVSCTIGTFTTWQAQFRLCGTFCLAVWLVAFLLLRELRPALRDQIMVSDRDRLLNELRARGLDVEASLRNPWRQVLRADILASAFGVSVLLLVYYTAVAFGVIYLVAIFHFSLERANELLNWNWAANVVSLLAGGLLSDRLGVRKPLMLAGGLGGALTIWLFLTHRPNHPSFAGMAAAGSVISLFVGAAYAAWMASFTETIEAHNPALTATGLAVWGWVLRLVVSAAFVAIPKVVAPVTSALKWQHWFVFCACGAVVFVAMIFTMKGRWTPAAARADAAAHEAEVAASLITLQGR